MVVEAVENAGAQGNVSGITKCLIKKKGGRVESGRERVKGMRGREGGA